MIKVWCALLGLALSGCTGWSVTDPAGSLGRWKPQPVVQPILQTLSAAEETTGQEFANAEDPTPEDLQVIAEDYVIGPRDVINVQIFELLQPDIPYGEQLVVDDLGFITIQHQVGQIKADGLTSDELTERIKEVLYPNILRDPQVGVTVVVQTHRTFAVIGAVREPRRYFLSKADYRLLDALAEAQDIVNANIPYVYVIRRPPKAKVVEGAETAEAEPGRAVPSPAEPAKVGPPQLSPEEELEELLKGIPGKSAGNDKVNMSEALLFSDVSVPSRQGGRAKRMLSPETKMSSQQGRGFDWSTAKNGKKLPFAGRVIRIPLKELRGSNANAYDIVIRNNDVVHVPLTEFGYYYVGGQVNRRGPYQLGAIPLTLTRAIIGAGGLSVVAEPTKVDITRRIGEHKQEIVQVDLAKIFAGVQPDYYIKRDDIINVGTSPVSPWLA
ncbi:MAG: polysaccharide biosynthesis/export family protein, partial [Phycisphaerae bacterium]|nr:polysaccharide biosynthesis/export family protein [Phycisphaerae bacterium]